MAYDENMVWHDSEILAAIKRGDVSWFDFDEVTYQSALYVPVENIELLPHYEVRVWELAKMLGSKSRPVLMAFRAMGRNVKSSSSRVQMEWKEYEAFKAYFEAGWVDS